MLRCMSMGASNQMMGTRLRYPYEVRKADDLFSEIEDFKVAPDMRSLDPKWASPRFRTSS